MTHRKMPGRLGWHGQCACCNGPRGKDQVRAAEKRDVRSEVADEYWADPLTRRSAEEGSVTPRHRTGSRGAPWVEYDSPKPPAVPDRYAFWTDPPPLLSARCQWWLRQIVRGWRPPKRVRYEGYDGAAQWYGVWIWEYFNIIDPALSAPLPGAESPGRPTSAMDAWVRAEMNRRAHTNGA